MGAGIGVHLVRLVFRDGAQSAGLTDRRDAHHLPGRAARHWFFFFFFFKKKEDTNITDVVEELGPCLAPSPRRVPLLLCVRQFLIIHSTINMLCVKQVRLASV